MHMQSLNWIVQRMNAVCFKPVFAAALLMIAVPAPVHADSDKGGTKVGGAFVTNFIADDQTAGTATGDLKGALGVRVLGIISGTIGDGKPVSLRVRHFWVTETGDTVQSEDAVLSAYPGASPSQPLLYSFVYENEVKVVGGTGRFENARGSIKAWGAVDLGAGEVVGRYAGEINFKGNGKR